MKLRIELDDNAEYYGATCLREHLLQVLLPEFYDVLPIEIKDAKLRHAYVPDGRPGFDDGICVASGSGGMCGRPRSEHP